MKTKIIAEIGINHNGSLELTKKLIDIASVSGCDYVKFQKRNPDLCVPENEKLKIKNTPWGEMTYIDYKHRIEFGENEYDEIDKYCKEKNIGWFASVWDKDSVNFMSKYKTKIDENEVVVMKIPSALITNDELINYARQKSNYLMLSTGMSTEEEIEKAIHLSNPNLIFHTNSTYPTPVNELNLEYIKWLSKKYKKCEIGYSGHEFGLTTTFGAVILGAKWIERHITIDRTMWGSDQMASIEPTGLIKLVKGIRDLELSMGGYEPRKIYNGELSKRKSLRGV
jgi:N-acetylneuraminate synthase